jgi:hypothetical protein
MFRKLRPKAGAHRDRNFQTLPATPLVGGSAPLRRRMRPSRHADRSSPTDTTLLTRIRINSTPLSAHRQRCQASFLRPHFVAANPLAKVGPRCSAPSGSQNISQRSHK